MQRFVATSTAAQRFYTCIPCLQRLRGLDYPSPSVSPLSYKPRRSLHVSPTHTSENTTRQDQSRKLSKNSRAVDRADAQEVSSDSNQERQIGQNEVADTELSCEKSSESVSGAETKSKKKIRTLSTPNGPDEGSTTTKPSRSKGGLTESDEGHGEIKTGKKAGTQKQKSLSIEDIRKQHKRLRSDIRSFQKQRMKEKTTKGQRTVKSIRREQLDMKKRMRHLEIYIGKAMGAFYPEGSEPHNSLKSINQSLADMTRQLEEALLAGSANPENDRSAPEGFTGANQLRLGKALKQLIKISAEVPAEDEDLAIVDGRPENDQQPAVRELRNLLKSGHKSFSSMNGEEKALASSHLQVLVPAVEKKDQNTLLWMFAAHIQGEAELKSTGTEISKSAGAKTLMEALRSTKKGERSSNAAWSPVAADSVEAATIDSRALELEPIHVEQPPVRELAYGLDRVLFNPGVYMLRDPRSKTYNFDPYLEKIMPVQDFNFDMLQGFVTSSQDTTLQKIARENEKRYTGSSSSLTGMLSHFHYLLSKFRPINTCMMSRAFNLRPHHSQSTIITQAPTAAFLRWKPDQKLYAIDSDKTHDELNVLSLLGHSLERLLTLPTAEYEKFRKGKKVASTEAEEDQGETYHYTGAGDILLRSQLDAYDSRLPGTGMFDLKTRAILPIRLDVQNFLKWRDYEIRLPLGSFESFEREWMDMMRATMLKYLLQVRIGRMDGIFVAYHNTQRIFGFQYAPIEDLDLALHGQRDRSIGDEEFKLSVKLLNQVLNRATEKFPEQSIRLHMRTVGGTTRTRMLIFAEPVAEDEADKMQKQNAARNEAIMQEIMSGILPTFDSNSRRIFPGQEAKAAVEQEAESDLAQAVRKGSETPSEKAGSSAQDVTDTVERQMSEEDEILDDLSSKASAAQKASSGENSNQEGPSLDSADEFLETIDGDVASMAAENRKPLLAMELTVDNFVNGESVRRPGFDEDADPLLRVEDTSTTFSTSKGDSWTAEYDIREVKDAELAWRMYLALKKARATLTSPERDHREMRFIMDSLVKYVDKGREHRQRRDQEDAKAASDTPDAASAAQAKIVC